MVLDQLKLLFQGSHSSDIKSQAGNYLGTLVRADVGQQRQGDGPLFRGRDRPAE